jgi:hypothetical protein
MFLPFLLALIAVVCFNYKQRKTGLVLWLLLLVSISVLFVHHADDVLNLRF